MIFGMAMMAPLYLWESAAIAPVVPTWPAIAAIVFVATLPSIGAVYLINAGIAVVGPARMGIFNYLQPLFVAAIAIPFLGERLSWYHPIALALVARGIVISSRGRGAALGRRAVSGQNPTDNTLPTRAFRPLRVVGSVQRPRTDQS